MAADHTAAIDEEEDGLSMIKEKMTSSTDTTTSSSSPYNNRHLQQQQHRQHFNTNPSVASIPSSPQGNHSREENAMVPERRSSTTMTSSSSLHTGAGTERYGRERSPQNNSHHQHHPNRPTLPPLLPTSMENPRELAPLGRSPQPSSPSATFNHSSSSGSFNDFHSSNSAAAAAAAAAVYNPRRFRSASEATAHHPPYRSLFAPPPPPFSNSPSNSSTTGPHAQRDNPYLREPSSNLPSLSRFHANIRRSNTFSAGLLHYSSPLGGGGGGGTAARPSAQLLPPSSNIGGGANRIFSRKFSDAASTTSSSSSSFRPQLPSLGATVSSPSFSSGSGLGSPHYHQSSWHHQERQPGTMMKEPLTPGGMSTSSSFSTTTTNSSGLAAAAANLSGFGGGYSPSSSTTVKGSGGNRRREPSISDSSTAVVDDFSPNSRKLSKSHVPSACLNCKKAHLACDVNRPCRRCINLGKVDTCVDVRHKKRGRPRLRDRELSNNSITMFNPNTTTTTTTTSNSSSTSPPRTTMPPHTPPHYQSIHPHTSPYHMGRDRSVSSASMSVVGGGGSGMGRDRSVSSASMHMEGVTRGPPIKINDHYPQHPHQHHHQQESSSSSELSSTMQNWMIFSTSLHCARSSTSTEKLLQLFPYSEDFLGKFFLDFIHPNDVERVQKMWNLLIEPVDVPIQPIYSHPEMIMQMQKEDLLSPAIGTVFLREENVRIRSNNVQLIDEQQQHGQQQNENSNYANFTVGFHLGGGAFGVDLYRKHTFDRAYIVVTIW